MTANQKNFRVRNGLTIGELANTWDAGTGDIDATGHVKAQLVLTDQIQPDLLTYVSVLSPTNKAILQVGETPSIPNGFVDITVNSYLWGFNNNGTTKFPNYTLPAADGTASQVLTTDGAGNVTWALPGGGGSTFGNITIAVVTDNTISTTTGDLIISAAFGSKVGISSDQRTRITRTTTTTASPINALEIRSDTSGTPAVGFGTSMTYQVETAAATFKDAGYINVQSTDITSGSENFKMNFGLMTNGATADDKMSLDTSGNLTLDGGITVSGSTSGSSTFNAPATGSTLTYTLPGAYPSTNGYVLTSTTGGTLSWAVTGNPFDQSLNTTNAVTFSAVTIDSRSSIDTATPLTTTSTATVALLTSTRLAMDAMVTVVQGADTHVIKALILKTSTTTAMLTTYGEMYDNIPLATFSADATGGSLRLLVTPVNATSMTFNAVRTTLD
jgi:hypothetical protein